MIDGLEEARVRAMQTRAIIDATLAHRPHCADALKITLNREGGFDVNCIGDDSTQCGIRGRTRKLYYKVKIVGREDCLTPEGFIIDNNEVHDYFVNTYTNRHVDPFPSCETIACRAVRDLRAMFGREHLSNVRVFHISVSISGTPQAVGLTAEWQDGTNN